MDHAMVFSTGYQANLGIISTIAGKDDYIILDIDSHASIYDGCALGNAQIVPFRHNDVEALEKRLEAHPRGRRQAGRARRRLFDARRHRAAQGDGRGLQGQWRDGAGRRSAFDGLHRRAWPRRRRGPGRHRRRRFHHRHLLQVGRHGRRLLRLQPSEVRDPAAGLPPLRLHRLAAAVRRRDRRDLDPQADAQRRQARASVGEFASASTPGLRQLGFTLGTDEPQSAIIAVIMPDLETGAAMWEALLNEGLYVNLARPPATPAGHDPAALLALRRSTARSRSARFSACSLRRAVQQAA